MTHAQDALAAGRAAMAAHFPTQATYTPPGGAATAAFDLVISATPDERRVQDYGDIDRVRMASATIRAAHVATPVCEGLVTIATGNWAGSWRIVAVQALAGGDHDVDLVEETPENTQAPDAGWARPLG